jgi:hypothetical protein
VDEYVIEGSANLYHNMDFSNNGIYIVLEATEEIITEFDSINSPLKLLFSQGVFKILEK